MVAALNPITDGCAAQSVRNGTFLTVPANCFRPAQRKSAFVRMVPLRQSLVEASKEGLFASIVSAAFSQRRKTLRNTLRRYLKPEDYAVLKIDPGLRAENLSVAEFVAITNGI
jgi:16S rRNA (adenine1518-N6/adenine1519-N6)-dimethyltransferase